MTFWLLEENVLKRMEHAIAAGAIPSADKMQAHREGVESAAAPFEVRGKEAVIPVKGVLTKSPDLFAMLFGGRNTTYKGIIDAIGAAGKDSSVESIRLAIDSPGGQFDGLFDALAAIQESAKPVTASVEGMAASAAYAIAGQADKIVAKNRASRVGSIGVVASFYTNPNVVDIASTDAPKKSPDVSTDEGKAIVREELDAIHALFADSIAAGRKTTVEKVNAEFGQGATLLAEDALSRGMIDAIEGGAPMKLVDTGKSTANGGGTKTESKLMDLETLKAQHPAVYQAAAKEGADKERGRCKAHLKLGETAGALDIALKAIRDGEEVTQELSAEYMAAAMNKRDTENRAADEQSAANAVNSAKGEDEGITEGEKVARAVAARVGVTEV